MYSHGNDRQNARAEDYGEHRLSLRRSISPGRHCFVKKGSAGVKAEERVPTLGIVRLRMVCLLLHLGFFNL